MKTLREVADIVGLSRRMIQEYEKTGLATTPTTTNKYGHLLYNEEEIAFLSDEKRLRFLACVGELFGTTAYRDMIGKVCSKADKLPFFSRNSNFVLEKIQRNLYIKK